MAADALARGRPSGNTGRFEFGDSPQQIDWRRSARSDRLYVRQTEWEAAQSVWLWPDLTASMRYTSNRNRPEKCERAAVLALALASLLITRAASGSRCWTSPNRRPPAAAVLDRIAMSVLRDMSQDPSGDDLPTPPLLPRHSNVVLISDFLVDTDRLMDLLGRIAARGVRGHLLQILDPSEVSLPFRGRTRFEGLESEGELLVGRAESLRESYLERLDSLQSTLATFARRANWTYGTHLTNGPPEPAMLSLFTNMTEAPHART